MLRLAAGGEHGDVVILVGSPEDLYQPVGQVGDRQPGRVRLDQAVAAMTSYGANAVGGRGGQV
jgi:hypothetical protein